MQTLVIAVSDATDANHVRHVVEQVADSAGLSMRRRQDAALLVTEIATNLVLHTSGGGHVLCRALASGEGCGIEVMGVDRGPGMRDLERCFQDGYSSSGSLGAGLGAVRRLCDEFDVFSDERGTIIMARVREALPEPMVQVGAVSVAFAGEQVCGDGWALKTGFGATRNLLVCDGLGHGPYAHEAAVLAVSTFCKIDGDVAPPAAVAAVHDALGSTRGAAVACLRVDDAQVVLTGVGNVEASLANATRRTRLAGRDGTAGLRIPRLTEQRYERFDGALLIVHSDGIKSSWQLDGAHALVRKHPSLVAAVIWREFSRGRDDATVVVVR